MTFEELMGIMRAGGARSVLAKTLAANDNSKNQVYLGGGFGALNLLPHGQIRYEDGPQGGAVRSRQYADISMSWIDAEGVYPAPEAKLILYPRYPEVRLSGFLRGCMRPPSDQLGVAARIPGRILLLGVTGDQQILAHVVAADSEVAASIGRLQGQAIGVFVDLTAHLPGAEDPIDVISRAVRAVAALGWTPSVKLDRSGTPQPYAARNGAGYTLEAALGVRPNGNAEPDFEGWEVKQYAVRSFDTLSASNPVTLLTPEPDGGVYHGDLTRFMLTYGYADRNGVENRKNFGGVFRMGMERHGLTGLIFDMTGFDPNTGKILDDAGSVRLTDEAGTVAASWSYRKLLNHWQTKHALAAYVPSDKRGPPPEYRYSPRATLYIGTDFIRLLKAFAVGAVYLDPALKATFVDGVLGPVHRRSQFRIRHADMDQLYERRIDLPEP